MKGSALCFWIFDILIFHANLLFSMKLIKNHKICEFGSNSVCIKLLEIFRRNFFWLCKRYAEIRRNSFQFPKSQNMWKWCKVEPRNNALNEPVILKTLQQDINLFLNMINEDWSSFDILIVSQIYINIYFLLLGELFRGRTVLECLTVIIFILYFLTTWMRKSRKSRKFIRNSYLVS